MIATFYHLTSEKLFPFSFFEMILIAPETKQEMVQTILYLIGFPSKILDNAAARILWVSSKCFFVLSWDTGFGRKMICHHTNIYIWWYELKFFWRNTNLAWLFLGFSFCLNIFFDETLYQNLNNIKNLCIKKWCHWWNGFKVWNLQRSGSRTDATKLKNAILVGTYYRCKVLSLF